MIEAMDDYELKEKFSFDHFCVLQCSVLEMEVLQLRKEGHIRAAFNEKEGGASFLIP
jgi:hypothetical protein